MEIALRARRDRITVTASLPLPTTAAHVEAWLREIGVQVRRELYQRLQRRDERRDEEPEP